MVPPDVGPDDLRITADPPTPVFRAGVAHLGVTLRRRVTPTVATAPTGHRHPRAGDFPQLGAPPKRGYGHRLVPGRLTSDGLLLLLWVVLLLVWGRGHVNPFRSLHGLASSGKERGALHRTGEVEEGGQVTTGLPRRSRDLLGLQTV